jgi:hypothetical protein
MGRCLLDVSFWVVRVCMISEHCPSTFCWGYGYNDCTTVMSNATILGGSSRFLPHTSTPKLLSEKPIFHNFTSLSHGPCNRVRGGPALATQKELFPAARSSLHQQRPVVACQHSAAPSRKTLATGQDATAHETCEVGGLRSDLQLYDDS